MNIVASAYFKPSRESPPFFRLDARKMTAIITITTICTRVIVYHRRMSESKTSGILRTPKFAAVERSVVSMVWNESLRKYRESQVRTIVPPMTRKSICIRS